MGLLLTLVTEEQSNVGELEFPKRVLLNLFLLVTANTHLWLSCYSQYPGE